MLAGEWGAPAAARHPLLHSGGPAGRTAACLLAAACGGHQGAQESQARVPSPQRRPKAVPPEPQLAGADICACVVAVADPMSGPPPPHWLALCMQSILELMGNRLHCAATACMCGAQDYEAPTQRGEGGDMLLLLLRAALWLMPSGIAFAIGMYISPRFTLPRVIGAAIEQSWLWWRSHSHSSLMVIVASGLVLGEGTASILVAFIKALS